MVTTHNIPAAVHGVDGRVISLLDVRTSALHDSGNPIRDQIVAGMVNLGEKWPAAVLFDECGLQIYDKKVTQSPGYYPYLAETRILQNHVEDIARAIFDRRASAPASAGEDIVELGSGPMKKTALLLSAFSRRIPKVGDSPASSYFALDLDKRELIRTLGELGDSAIGHALHGKIALTGLWGTYDDGLRFITMGGLEASTETSESSRAHELTFDEHAIAVPQSKHPPQQMAADRPSRRPLHMLFVGNSISNFTTRQEASAFLKSLPLRPRSDDTLLLGMDQNDDVGQIELAYDHPAGDSREFLMNALVNAGRILGDERLFSQDDWEYGAHFNTSLPSRASGRFEYHFKSKRDQTIVDPVTGSSYSFQPYDEILSHVSYKFSPDDAQSLFADANLRPLDRWTDQASKYTVWLLERPAI
ncbi:hypothetical protein BN946_scf184657.g37 [Trametes cinnabarina]|uniref:Histidine-specific methyltransferase SAM-dependent domain-containing protein n=1 Tax=Pycnoporus cinnabarinus TaxID=5643 RepID=A0A060SRI0_PYCCI|nr:hypothetical protein BN946_scf184657.g37 [Trametes cinnabarina]